MSNKLIEAIVELKEDEAVALAGELLDGGTAPQDVLNFGITAMEQIGARFEANEYFLPELLMAGDIMEAINTLALPLMAGDETEATGEKVILGTVAGDIHDIGKNIVRFMLETNGYAVIDLGVDVPPATFVNAVKEEGASIVGLSALLTVSFDSMKATIDALAEAGLRDQVKVMIGGAPVDETVLGYSNADARGDSAVAAVNLANDWTEGN